MFLEGVFVILAPCADTGKISVYENLKLDGATSE
jgi:hypothetical protein